jgi:ATP-dependent helicase/nuclease subunit A
VSQYPARPAIDPWSLLADSLQHQLELEEVKVQPAIAEELQAMPDIDGWSAARHASVEKALRPSYRIASVTSLAKSGSEVAPIRRSAEGKGMSYGTLVHRSLQALGEGIDAADLPLFCKVAAGEEDVEEKWIEQALEAVRRTSESELWERCMRSKRRFFEFSFQTARHAEESTASGLGSDGAAPGMMLLRGIIDLVFEDDDGWVIADFKTDHHDASQEEQLAAYYRPQVKAYAEEWERLTGGAVKEAGLYFLHTHRYFNIPL